MNKGALVISLDFEKYWGMRDKRSISQYEDNLINVDEVVSRTLELFDKYSVRATWATVGMLLNDDLYEHKSNIPEAKPEYYDGQLSPYPYLQQSEEIDLKYHSALDSVLSLKNYVGQEFATHTYSHMYFLEDGVSNKAIESDFLKFKELASKHGFCPISIVFPRNQYDQNTLETIKQFGIKTYRGNESSWLYRPSKDEEQGQLRRLLRLIDSVANISGHHIHEIGKSDLVNIPSSRFLRPITGNRVYDSLHLRRVKRTMLQAAKEKKVFHLWWHPHNFGKNMQESFERLEQILQYFLFLKKRYDFESLNMADFVKD